MATFHSIIPVLRIFDVGKAEEFYNAFLGFKIDWDHRFEDKFPLYRQLSRGGLVLHLSEHHGDCTPGSYIRIMVTGIRDLHRELLAKKNEYMKPGIEKGPSEMLEVSVIDPFGNKLTFCERVVETPST